MAPKHNLVYGDLTYDVIGCAFEAFKEVGVGFSEIIYHKVFHQFLLEKGLNTKYKVRTSLDYLGETIGDFEIDEIVENKLIVELKFIQTDFLPENLAQLFTYLKITKHRLGLLINFGLHKVSTKRIIFDEQRIENYEKWDNSYFKNLLKAGHLEGVKAAIHAVNRVLGPGYHSKLYRAALKIELAQKHIKFKDNVFIKIVACDIEFEPMEIDYWLIENEFLLGILACKNEPRVYDIFRMRSYLKRLDLTHGLIAYWSTKNLQLHGICV